MQAFKGFTKDLTAAFGRGNKQYHPGETLREEKSSASSCGMHCAEDPLYCAYYYPLGTGRFFLVEAAGSLDEDGNTTQIACTEMTLVKELSIKELAGYGMIYMVKHPGRDWEKSYGGVSVKRNKAEGHGKYSIAIARGKAPQVRGAEDAVLGLIVEKESGEITAAKLFTAGRDAKPDTWYTLDASGKIKEVRA